MFADRRTSQENLKLLWKLHFLHYNTLKITCFTLFLFATDGHVGIFVCSYCFMFQNEGDADNLREIKYFPNYGFSFKHYPYFNQPNYLPPFIFVQFDTPREGALIQVITVVHSDYFIWNYTVCMITVVQFCSIEINWSVLEVSCRKPRSPRYYEKSLTPVCSRFPSNAVNFNLLRMFSKQSHDFLY